MDISVILKSGGITSLGMGVGFLQFCFGDSVLLEVTDSLRSLFQVDIVHGKNKFASCLFIPF